MATSTPRSKRTLFWIAKATVSVGLLVLLFTSTDTSAFLAQLSGVDGKWIGFALVCQVVITALSAWRWRRLLAVQSVNASWALLGRSFLIANFANNFMPSNIGGDFVRVAHTAGMTRSTAVAATVVVTDRALGFLAMMLVASVGALVATFRGLEIPGAGYLWFTFSFVLGVTSVLLARPFLLGTIRQRLPLPSWLAPHLERLSGTLARFQSDPRALATVFCGAVIVQLVLTGFYVCVAYGLMIPLSLAGAVVIVQVSRAIQMLPISLNGFGVREATFVYFFSRLGLGRAEALALSLAGVAIVMLYSLSGAVLLVADRRRSVTT